MYVTAKNIKESGVSLDNMTFVTSEVFRDVFSRCNPELGDILYIKDGATTGVVTINDIKDPFCLLSSVALIKPSKSIDRKYLLYYLRSSTCYSSVRESMKGVGITRVTLKQIENWVVPIPPLSEQKRIVDEVEKWFVQIDAIEQDSSDLKDAVQKAKSKILDLALSGRLTSDTSHYGKNEEWDSARISDICTTINGLWTGKKEPFVKVGVIRNANFTKDFNLDYSKIALIDVEASSFSKRSLMTGDLIVEKSGGSDKYPVGRAVLYEGPNSQYSFSNFTMVLRPKESNVINPKYLYYFLMNRYLQGIMRTMQTQTTGLHNLILDKFMSQTVALPPIEEQAHIVESISRYFTILDSISSSC